MVRRSPTCPHTRLPLRRACRVVDDFANSVRPFVIRNSRGAIAASYYTQWVRAVAKGQAERWGSHSVSACFVDLLKPGRDGDLVIFHHALLDQERQGAFNFLSSPAGTALINRLLQSPQHLSLSDRLQGGVVRKRCGDRPLALPLGMQTAQRF